MKRVAGWLRGLLSLAALAALVLVFVWLFSTARQGQLVRQRAREMETVTPEGHSQPTDDPTIEEATTLTATLAARLPARILYAVQMSRGAPDLWTLELTPEGNVLSLSELTVSPVPVEGLRLYEVSISPDGRYAALNLRGRAEDLSVEVWTVDLVSGSMVRLPALHHRGLIFMGWVPETNRILARDLDGAFVALLNPDGSDVQELPFHMFQDGAVSPDGKLFVLSALEETAFWFVDTGGNLVEKISVLDKEWPGSGGPPYGLTWSPSGKKLAYFDNLINEMSQIRVMGIDDHRLKYLSSDDAHNIFPVWSEDSLSLLYLREDTPGMIQWDGGDPNTWNSSLWIADVETEQGRELVPSKGKASWSPAWLPGDAGIAFISNRAGQGDVWIVDRDGSNLKQLTVQGGVVALAVYPGDGK